MRATKAYRWMIRRASSDRRVEEDDLQSGQKSTRCGYLLFGLIRSRRVGKVGMFEDNDCPTNQSA